MGGIGEAKKGQEESRKGHENEGRNRKGEEE